MSSSKLGFIGWLYILLAVIVVGVLVIVLVRPFNKVSNIRDITVTVTEKTVKNGEDSGKYLVFGEDENGTVHTFEITDSWLRFRFNSSDVYASIKPGNKYKFTVGGSRNHLLSWYPNIYEYKLLEQKE